MIRKRRVSFPYFVLYLYLFEATKVFLQKKKKKQLKCFIAHLRPRGHGAFSSWENILKHSFKFL